jgi:hypothetical protein
MTRPQGLDRIDHCTLAQPTNEQEDSATSTRSATNKDEAGQALYETALVLPVLLVLLVGVILFGPLAYTRLAVDAASYDCVTAAIEAVSDENQAVYQGRVAANRTIQGFRLNPGHASVFIWTNGSWGPGAQMVCQVDYDFNAVRIPGVSTFFPGSGGILSGETALAVESHKSDWW